MKQLSIEQKAQAYDIALDKIKRLLGTGSNCSREELEYVFPELAESEDERIKKELLAVIDDLILPDEQKERFIAWLERHGEEEPAEWSEEDEQLYNDLSDTYFYNDEDYPEETYKLMLKRVLDWLTKRAKSLRPQSTWKPSDEQMDTLEDAIRYGEEENIGILSLLYNDLKKLKG